MHNSLGETLVAIAVALALVFGLAWAVSLSESMTKPFLSLDERIADCREKHPDWHSYLCRLIAERKVSESRVMEHPDWPWLTITAKKIGLGMTDETVLASWGNPRYKNEHGFLGYDQEWAYNGHCLGFRNGVLMDIEEAPLWKASSIIAKYESNEIAANEKFQGKMIMVIGYIQEVGENAFGELYIELEGGDFMDDVRCYFSTAYRYELATLHRGQKVVIKGRGLGKGLFTVDFTSCLLFWKRT